MSIIIDPEFKSLIPPLSDDEFRQLEENCVRDGIRDALIVWPQGDGNDILIDGHNRFDISAKHAGIPFQIKRMEFKDRNAAESWIILNQFGRRNLTAYDRSVLALKLKKMIAEKAEKNLHLSEGRGSKGCQKSDKVFDTKKELAKIAGVSHDTIHKVERIEAEAPESVKEALRQGRTTINRAYNDTFPKRPDPVKQARQEHKEFQKKKEESAIVKFQDIQKDKDNQKILNNVLIQDILKLAGAGTDFTIRHSYEDVEKLGEDITEEYRKHLIDVLQKCCNVISRIQVSLFGGE